MENTMKNMLLAASLAALTIPVGAQDTSADPKLPARKPAFQTSSQRQYKPIVHGASSKKATSGEAASLEKKEANDEERDMREDNRGRLTMANRAKIHHQQNQVSKAAHSKQHNPGVVNVKAKSAGLHAKTQRPAHAELKTGQLTASQAGHLETKETSLRRDIHSDREETGGKPKSGDHEQTNQPPNKSTNEIHLKKHNARMF